MQARRTPSVQPFRPSNVDRRKGFMEILERLALGVITTYSAVGAGGSRRIDRPTPPSVRTNRRRSR